MISNSNSKQKEPNCNDIEILLYLQDDELSSAELKTRKQHLQQCSSCQAEYENIRQQNSRIKFEPTTESFDHLIKSIQNRVDDPPKQTIDRIKPWIFQKRVQLALTAACILFFIVFSVEQVNTISRISKLESRVQKKSPTSSLQYQKGELLVINHFISREELRTIADRHLNSSSKISFLSHRSPIYNWSLWQQGLTSVEKKNFINDLLNQVPTNIPLLRMGKISNLNSDIIKPISQNH